MASLVKGYITRITSSIKHDAEDLTREQMDDFIRARLKTPGIESGNIFLDLLAELGIDKPKITNTLKQIKGIPGIPIQLHMYIDEIIKTIDDPEISKGDCRRIISNFDDFENTINIINEKAVAGSALRNLVLLTGHSLKYYMKILAFLKRIIHFSCTEGVRPVANNANNANNNVNNSDVVSSDRYRKHIDATYEGYALQLAPATSLPEKSLNNIDDNNSEEYSPHQISSCLRAVSSCRGQKAMLFLHSVGSGKTRTALCIASNYNSNDSGINIIIITPDGLDTAFKEELGKDWAMNNPQIQRSSNKFIYVTYSELYIDALNSETKLVKNIYKNAVIIADEAHRLIPIVRDGKVANGLLRLFKLSLKLIIMTGTPLQEDWSDFGFLLNIVIQLNGKREIDTVSDLTFRNEFYTPNTLTKLGNMSYALIFRSIGEYWLSITTLGIISDPNAMAYILTRFSPIIIKILPTIITSKINLVFNSTLLTGIVGPQLATSLTPILSILILISCSLKAADSIITTIAGNKASYPINTELLINRIAPFIDFSDYKSLEIEYINNSTTKQRKLTIQNELKRYPVLNMVNFSVPYTDFQRPLYNICTSKGIVPDNYELAISGRIQIDDNDRVDPSTFISVNDEKLFNVLRCIGNATPDSIIHGTRRCKISDMHRKTANNYRNNWCYIASDSRLEKLSPELKNYYVLTKEIDVKFGCEKYEAILDIIKHARMKFHHLPVIYSNFVKQGMETFSAYLTSQDILHIVIHLDQTVEERQELIALAKQAYERYWYYLKSGKELTKQIENQFEQFNNNKIIIADAIENITHTNKNKILENIYKNKKQLLDNIIGADDDYVDSIRRQPLCVIVHPDLLEGLDFVNNEVMICLEPMVGLGNQEQVYGRISRSLGKKEDGSYEWEGLYTSDYNQITISENIFDEIEDKTLSKDTLQRQNYVRLKPVYELIRRYFVNHHPIISKSMNIYFNSYNTQYNRTDIKLNNPILKVKSTETNDLQKDLKRFQKYIIQFKSTYYPTRKRFNDTFFFKGPFETFNDPLLLQQFRDSWKNYNAFLKFIPLLIANRNLPFYRRTDHDYSVSFRVVDGKLEKDYVLVDLIRIISNTWKTVIFNYKVKELYYITDSIYFKLTAIIYRNKDAMKNPAYFMAEGQNSISFETPDLLFDARLELQAEEYKRVRIALSGLTKQAITKDETGIKYNTDIYYQGRDEFPGGCNTGREYYPSSFADNSKCHVTRIETNSDDMRCDTIGPIAITRMRRTELARNTAYPNSVVNNTRRVTRSKAAAAPLPPSRSSSPPPPPAPPAPLPPPPPAPLTPATTASADAAPTRRGSTPTPLSAANGFDYAAASTSTSTSTASRLRHSRPPNHNSSPPPPLGAGTGLGENKKHTGGGLISIEEFVAPDTLTQEDINDISRLIAPYKDVSTVEEIIDIAEERLKEQSPGLRQRRRLYSSNEEVLEYKIENSARNLSVLQKDPSKLKVSGGYKNKTMYKRMKSRRTTRRKSRKY